MGYKTLIVEDDAVQRLKTAHYFKQAGYTVFEATDSNEMNSILACNKIDRSVNTVCAAMHNKGETKILPLRGGTLLIELVSRLIQSSVIISYNYI